MVSLIFASDRCNFAIMFMFSSCCELASTSVKQDIIFQDFCTASVPGPSASDDAAKFY
jgi:hypothetical protein